MQTPNPHTGMRHLALSVTNLEACVDFYHKLLGMTIEWQPDADNVYLTSGNDNLALHRTQETPAEFKQQRLDHLGFILQTPEDVDAWHDYLAASGVKILKATKSHRDGAKSFYCADPDGNVVQLIYHPPLCLKR